MERFYRHNANPSEQSRASSVYSTDSIKYPERSESIKQPDTESMTSTSSRPTTGVPSYMNAVPARKPISQRLATPSTSSKTEPTSAASPSPAPAPPAKGTLFLVIVAKPHPSTLSYLGMMLKRSTYSEIAIVGSAEQEEALKQIKMNIYALLGKLSLEVGVNMELQKGWSESEISAAISMTAKAGEPIHGVLCSPSLDCSLGEDVFALDEGEFERPWKSSVGFLQCLAKCTVPKLLENNNIQRGNSGLFLVTPPLEDSPVSSVFKAACDRVIALLADANAGSDMTVAYADTVLIPEPEPESVDTNGKLHLETSAGPRDADFDYYPPPESPTKLWNMWALQDEYAD